MTYISIGVADIRVEPKFQSERDSQVIYGEDIDLLEDKGEYSKIRSRDGVTGFVKTYILTEGDKRKYKLKSFFDAGKVKLPFGSLLSDDDASSLKIPEEKLVKIGDKSFSVVELAKKFLGVPYLWGGTSDFGFDCSGFVQRLYRFVEIELPRNADQQRDFSRTVEDFYHAVPGDLVFFKGHVALYLGNGTIIHANGHMASVSINNMFDGSEYSKQLQKIFEKIGRIEGSIPNPP